MTIYSIKGRLEEVAPDLSQVVVLWAYNNWTSRQAFWEFALSELNLTVNSITPELNKIISGNDYLKYKPWYEPFDTLWKLEPVPYKKLEYIYVYSNSKNQPYLTNFDQIDLLIARCFNKLKTLNIKSASFLLIPASESPLINNDFDLKLKGENNFDDDLRSAKQMIDSMNKWMQTNNYILDIYLIDRLGDFELALNS